MAARRLGEVLGGKGKVGVIGFMPGSGATLEREEGFAEELKAKFPGMQLVGLQFGMADRAKAMAATENMIAAHPDLAGLFADNESSSSGAVQALKSRKARNLRLVAFDSSEQLVADVREGWIDALIVQDPFRMGYESVRAIGEKKAGRSVAAELDSGARLILKTDLDQQAVKEFLFPDLSRWLKPSGGH